MGQQAVEDLFEGPDVQVLVNFQDYLGMDVHFAKAAVGVAIAPLVQPASWAEPVVGVVGFDLKIQSLNDHFGFGCSASFVGYYY